MRSKNLFNVSLTPPEVPVLVAHRSNSRAQKYKLILIGIQENLFNVSLTPPEVPVLVAHRSNSRAQKYKLILMDM